MDRPLGSRRAGALGLAALTTCWLLAWSLLTTRVELPTLITAGWLVIGLAGGVAAVRLAWLRPFSEVAQPRS